MAPGPRIDLNSIALSLLVRLSLQEGRLANAKRKGFLAKDYKEETLAVVEAVAVSVMAGRGDDGNPLDEIPPCTAD